MRLPAFSLLLLAVLSASLGGEPVATLRRSDVVEMKLGGVPLEQAGEFNLQYTVNSDGDVNMPLIGKMRAVGLTPQQLEEAVQSKLVADKIFTQPTVILNVQSSARYVTVGGGVRQPQRVPWTSDLTLFWAVQLAGGPGDYATLKDLKLVRDSKVQVFDGRNFEKDPGQAPKLLPGDQVFVKGQ